MDDKKRRDTTEEDIEVKDPILQEEHIENNDEIVSPEDFTALTQTAAKFEDAYKRALADYQNLVRRTQEEKREWAKLSNKDLVLKLLPILDTLMLAEKHTKDQNFVMTVQQFLQVLKDEGIERIVTIGEEFNPHTMEAVSTVEGDTGKVVEEARAGYMFENVVLRPAQVIVGA